MDKTPYWLSSSFDELFFDKGYLFERIENALAMTLGEGLTSYSGRAASNLHLTFFPFILRHRFFGACWRGGVVVLANSLARGAAAAIKSADEIHKTHYRGGRCNPPLVFYLNAPQATVTHLPAKGIPLLIIIFTPRSVVFALFKYIVLRRGSPSWFRIIYSNQM